MIKRQTSLRAARASARLKAGVTVGQNRFGQWLAVAADGLAGGIFASRDAALRYAAAERSGAPVRITRRPIELRI